MEGKATLRNKSIYYILIKGLIHEGNVPAMYKVNIDRYEGNRQKAQYRDFGTSQLMGRTSGLRMSNSRLDGDYRAIGSGRHIDHPTK